MADIAELAGKANGGKHPTGAEMDPKSSLRAFLKDMTMDAEERLWNQLDAIDRRLQEHIRDTRAAHGGIYARINELRDQVVAHRERWMIVGALVTIALTGVFALLVKVFG